MKRLLLALGIVAVLASAASTPCRAQSCAPVLNGLVGWWRGENNAEDSVGANNGTLANGGSYAPAEVGQGFSLDGVNDNVVIPATPSLNITGALSIEAWIKPDSASLGSIASQYETPGSTQVRFAFLRGASGLLELAVYDPSGS